MNRTNKILIFSFLVAILLSCTDNDTKGKWIYSFEYGGVVYPGLIFDLENYPNTIYSLQSKNFCDTIRMEGSILFRDTTRIGSIIWKNKKCIVIKDVVDSMVFQKVPDLHLADSILYVLNFLTSNSILYKDEFSSLKFYLDTTLNERNFYNASVKNMNFTQNGFEYSNWRLEVINNSINLLLNKDSFSLTPSNLLITNITKDSISGEILGFPKNLRDSLFKAILNDKNLDFEYDSFTLKKVKNKTKNEIELLKEKLTSKIWKLSKIDSTYIGFGRINHINRPRVLPREIIKLDYNFTINNEYEISTNDSVYSGNFEISKDGSYIILDKKIYHDNGIQILEVDSLLKMEQIVNIYDSEGRYKIYNCKIEMK